MLRNLKTLRPLLVACVMMTSWTGSALIAERPRPSLLFVASHNLLGTGQYRFLVDPTLQRELENKGFAVGSSTMEALTEKKLRLFNAVIFQQAPDVDRYGLDKPFRRVCKLLPEYVRSGGGLFVFNDLHRGRIYANLNRLLRPFGAEVFYQVIEERVNSRVRTLAHYRACKAFSTDNIVISPLTAGVRRLWFPRFAGTTGTFQTDSNWQIAIRGSTTAHSRRLAGGDDVQAQPVYKQAPPIAAYRHFGNGRVVLFSSHSSWWTLNPYHFMWDEGFFLREGDGRQFIRNCFHWLTTADNNHEERKVGGFEASMQPSVFDISSRLKSSIQKTVSTELKGPWHKGLVGAHTRYSGGRATVGDFCERARKLGLSFLVFTELQDRMNAQSWSKLLVDCRQNTGETFVAIPGIQFLGRESGNSGVVFNIRKPWKELPWHQKAFDTFIRLGVRNSWLANQAQLYPAHGPLPYYNQGAVNAFLTFCYREPVEGRPWRDPEGALKMFLGSNANGWFLAPQTFHNLWRPEDLESAKNTFHTFFGQKKWGRKLQLGRDLLLNSFVSNGPVIRKFALTQPGPWAAPDDRVVQVSLAVSAQQPLASVRLWAGQRLLRCFRPRAKEFATTTRFASCQSQSVYLAAETMDGRKVFSKALPSSRVRFHHFIGGDRMNGYWWGAEPAPPQTATHRIAGQWSRLLGSLYPGLGWGDRIQVLNLNQLDHPYGLETGQPTGGVQRLGVSPAILHASQREFRHAGPHRSFPLNSTDCVIIRDQIGHELEIDSRGDFVTKRLRPAKTMAATVLTIGFRWQKAIALLIDTRIHWLELRKPSSQTNALLAVARARCDDILSAYRSVLYTAGGQVAEKPVPDAPSVLSLPAGDFVTVQPHPLGTPAFFAFQPSSFLVYPAFNRPELAVGRKWTQLLEEEHETTHFQFLFLLTPGGKKDLTFLEKFRDLYGFDGQPAYEVRMEHGELIDTTYVLRLNAERGGAAFSIAKATLPNPLPVTVEHLNGNWDAGVVDLENQRLLKRVAVWEHIGYFTLDLNRSHHLFAGNLLTSDNKDLRITVLSLQAGHGHILLHNPLSKAVTTRVFAPPRLKAWSSPEGTYFLPPGSEKEIEW